MYCIKYINLSKFATLPDNFEENPTAGAIYVLREEFGRMDLDLSLSVLVF